MFQFSWRFAFHELFVFQTVWQTDAQTDGRN